MDGENYEKNRILSAVYKRLNGSSACFAAGYDTEEEVILFGISTPVPYRGMIKQEDFGFLMVADYRTDKVTEDKIPDLISILNKKNSEMMRGKFTVDKEGNLHFENCITMYNGQIMNIDDFMIEFLLAGRMIISIRNDIDNLLDRMDGEFRIREE